MIKKFCDICGRELKTASYLEEIGQIIDGFQLCPNCMKYVKDKEDEWDKAKLAAFKVWFVGHLSAKRPAPHTHTCQCAKDGKAVVTTVGKGKCHCHRKTRKVIYGTADLAKQVGRSTDVVCHYATKNQIGKIVHGVRVYDEEQAEHIRSHFGESK